MVPSWSAPDVNRIDAMFDISAKVHVDKAFHPSNAAHVEILSERGRCQAMYYPFLSHGTNSLNEGLFISTSDH